MAESACRYAGADRVCASRPRGRLRHQRRASRVRPGRNAAVMEASSCQKNTYPSKRTHHRGASTAWVLEASIRSFFATTHRRMPARSLLRRLLVNRPRKSHGDARPRRCHGHAHLLYQPTHPFEAIRFGGVAPCEFMQASPEKSSYRHHAHHRKH